MARLETKKEKEVKRALELFKQKKSKSCRLYLHNTIAKTKDAELIGYFAKEIINEDESLHYFEPAIADNKYTPAYILAELALSKDPITRTYVAFNLNTPKNSIYILSKDECEFVRIVAKKNPNLPDKRFFPTLSTAINIFINFLKCLLGLN